MRVVPARTRLGISANMRSNLGSSENEVMDVYEYLSVAVFPVLSSPFKLIGPEYGNLIYRTKCLEWNFERSCRRPGRLLHYERY